MSIRLSNTLSGKVEEFRPIAPPQVRMYSCGPTVYDYGHIGNFRTFVAVDILRRFLKQSGYKLQHVMNITDVDDRIIERAAKQGVGVRQYTEKFEKAFLDDMDSLHCEHPEEIVRATDEINEMADFIAHLVEKGFAYRAEDGSYYFRIAKFPEYGKLSKKPLTAIEDGARVDSDRFDKEEVRDFALWKAPKAGEAFWETKIGKGRPGWHIECSAMAIKHLGETLDIHLGGEDLIFPHHENEIAQSESLTGKPFARYWVHARFLLIEADKMSKSMGNFFTLRDLVLMGHKPSSIRYLLASVPYRRQLNFTFDGLRQAAASVERVRNFKQRLESAQLPPGSNAAAAALASETSKKMTAALEDDLNTAEFLGALFEMVRQANALADAGELKKEDATVLLAPVRQFDEIFDVLRDDDTQRMRKIVEWGKKEGRKIEGDAAALASNHFLSDEQVSELIEQHNAARKAKDFAKSDAVRKQLADSGILVENTKEGVRWKRR
ncbi:MAG: cysteine--tRNA ligase [Terriglobales bacterium]